MKSEQTEGWVNLPAVPFDLQKTLRSGQVFHWKVETEACQGLVAEEVLILRRKQGHWQAPKQSLKLAARYFSLDHPLEKIWATFPDDPFSQAALRTCEGLRIIRQPQWECLATFITSSLKQVAHISQMSLSLRKKYGTSIQEGEWAYPTPEVLASLREEDLRACGLGFRARGLLGAARAVAAGDLDPEALKSMETPQAREVLMKIPGVGEKIANCVLLFAYERLEVVPVDVWIGRVLLQMRQGRRGTPAQLQKYSQRRFGPYAGYVQQYLFHHARTNKLMIK